jgi:scyllo-inositol 2-dehydrogenase (NADP+)
VAPAPGPRLRVQGSGGGFVVAELDPQEAALREGRRPDEADWGLPAESEYPRLTHGDRSETVTPEPGDWSRFYRLLRDALNGEGPLPVRPEEAIEVLRVLEAARESARDGVVVALDPEPS